MEFFVPPWYVLVEVRFSPNLRVVELLFPSVDPVGLLFP
jgi:hypothetical protein